MNRICFTAQKRRFPATCRDTHENRIRRRGSRRRQGPSRPAHPHCAHVRSGRHFLLPRHHCVIPRAPHRRHAARAGALHLRIASHFHHLESRHPPPPVANRPPCAPNRARGHSARLHTAQLLRA